jgi:AcrR family transcriptional regulator
MMRGRTDISTSRDRLLREAFRLFVTKGYDLASMADLADAAAVSKGAFHHYFPRKQDILRACIQTYFTAGLPEPWDGRMPERDYARKAAQGYVRIFARLRAEGISLVAYQAFLWTMIRDGHISLPPLDLREGEGAADMELILALIEGAGVVAALTEPQTDEALTDLFDRILSRGLRRDPSSV